MKQVAHNHLYSHKKKKNLAGNYGLTCWCVYLGDLGHAFQIRQSDSMLFVENRKSRGKKWKTVQLFSDYFNICCDNFKKIRKKVQK